MTFAKVSQFEQLAGNVEFLRRLNHILHPSLRLITPAPVITTLIDLVIGLQLKHLLDDRLVVVEVCHFSLQVVNSAIQV
jgi:hypothetical protein